MRSFFGIVACGAMVAASGCSSQRASSWKYPPPLFDTRAERPTAPQPRVQPAPSAPAIAGEPGWLPPGGIKQKWTDIVIHHSASRSGGAAAFDRYHRTVQHWDELGYHFVIGNGTDTRDGQVEVGGRWTKQKHGAHCKTPDNYYNEHGIGICLVGDFSKTSPSAAQLASLQRLLLFLTARCHIPVSRIRTHGGVTHKTQCPGRNFPLAQVQRNLTLSQRRMATAGSQ
ncbi:MAG TPA: peptidoglycan recognition family protein [Phycisphaerae bacterium]|nr:N-acetylmuramoyl-L-alanine amidase [Phycisphaerales bacterium]HRX84884.1 peptidoglycan recognition family protein [Phycisphaerae bacterium]